MAIVLFLTFIWDDKHKIKITQEKNEENMTYFCSKVDIPKKGFVQRLVSTNGNDIFSLSENFIFIKLSAEFPKRFHQREFLFWRNISTHFSKRLCFFLIFMFYIQFFWLHTLNILKLCYSFSSSITFYNFLSFFLFSLRACVFSPFYQHIDEGLSWRRGYYLTSNARTSSYWVFGVFDFPLL